MLRWIEDTGDMPDLELPEPLARAVTLVRDDREHGASWLARQAAQALADAAAAEHGASAQERILAISAAARAFARARPSMAAVANTAAGVWQAGVTAAQEPDARLAVLRAAAERLLGQWELVAEAIAGHARPVLGATVYTHSRSGTVEQVLLRLAADGAGARLIERIIVDESWPGGEGVAAARAFAASGVAVTLIADGACGLLLPEADTVVLGADSVRADGSVVNKVGSFPLAVTAHTLGVPVYALCETLKIAASEFPLAFEEMAPAELLPGPVPGITVRNVYFDRTPAEYVSGVVTEEGILDGAAIAARAHAAAEALAMLERDED
jgi:translation initiation factor 2B subunit (eIF-2B alpha/beta/delta family)